MAPGLGASGGPGFSLGAIDGLPAADDGRDVSEPPVFAFEGVIDFFQGVAEPFEGAIPGKTGTGLADASAVPEVGLADDIEGVGLWAAGNGRRPAGGGAAATLGFGGTSSR